MRALFARCLTWIALALLSIAPVTAQTWDSLLVMIRRKFPGVPQLSPRELAEWLADTNRPAPVLIDARDAREFAVSQLAGARNATSVAAVQALKLASDQPIVVYCSVGYRSSALAEKLAKSGFTRVSNLEGSIFAWANEGRPVHRGTDRVRQVHPYDTKWGELLDHRWHPPLPHPTVPATVVPKDPN